MELRPVLLKSLRRNNVARNPDRRAGWLLSLERGVDDKPDAQDHTMPHHSVCGSSVFCRGTWRTDDGVEIVQLSGRRIPGLVPICAGDDQEGHSNRCGLVRITLVHRAGLPCG